MGNIQFHVYWLTLKSSLFYYFSNSGNTLKQHCSRLRIPMAVYEWQNMGIKTLWAHDINYMVWLKILLCITCMNVDIELKNWGWLPGSTQPGEIISPSCGSTCTLMSVREAHLSVLTAYSLSLGFVYSCDTQLTTSEKLRLAKVHRSTAVHETSINNAQWGLELRLCLQRERVWGA